MRSVVITGASSGIGRATALHFNELGFRVFAGVRRVEDGEEVRLASTRPELCRPLLLDVTQDAQVESARDVVAREVGPGGLTALVSNAGIAALGGPTSCEECPLETQREVMEVNFFGAVRTVQAFLPLLRRSRGTIVVNTALIAHTVIPFNAGYAASKWALEGWTDSLRREVAPLGVRVAMVEAGYIASDLERKQGAVRAQASQVYPLEVAVRTAMSLSSTHLAGRATSSPRRVSELVVRSVLATRPRPRRVVGTGARPIWTLGLLPDRAQDAFFAALLPRLATRRRPVGTARRP